MDGYEEVIAHGREVLPRLTTPRLVRIRELLEQVLQAGDGSAAETRAVLDELARTLALGG